MKRDKVSRRTKKKLIYIAGALIVCAAFVIISMVLLLGNRTTLASGLTERSVLNIPADQQIVEMSWCGTNEMSFSLRNDTWYWTEDASFPLNQAYPQQFLAAFSRITVLNTIHNVGDLSDYYLDDPDWTVRLKTADGTVVTYCFAVDRAADKNCYAYIKDEPQTVYCVDKILLENLGAERQRMIEYEPLPKISNLKLIYVTDARDTQIIQYKEDKSGWYTYNGKLVDDAAMQTLKDTLSGLSWEYCANYNADEDALAAAGFNNGLSVYVSWIEQKQVATGEIDANDQPVTEGKTYVDYCTLLLGARCPDGYYARLDGSSMVYVISPMLYEALAAVFDLK